MTRGRRHSRGSYGHSIVSNCGELRIRGSARQIEEKYRDLALEAEGDRDYSAAENFRQHAEHYARLQQPSD